MEGLITGIVFSLADRWAYNWRGGRANKWRGLYAPVYGTTSDHSSYDPKQYTKLKQANTYRHT